MAFVDARFGVAVLAIHTDASLRAYAQWLKNHWHTLLIYVVKIVLPPHTLAVCLTYTLIKNISYHLEQNDFLINRTDPAFYLYLLSLQFVSSLGDYIKTILNYSLFHHFLE